MRVCRHLLALANRTLTDWADPEGKIGGDILLAIDKPNHMTAMSLFDTAVYGRKVDLLFGGRADLFKRAGDEAFEKAVLKLALEATAALRNASFHFKGLKAVAKALAGGPSASADPRVAEAVRSLWEGDAAGRAERLRQTMRADHFEFFFKEHQNRKLFAALSSAPTGELPLPRFARMLLRAENAWERENLRLPPAANRLALENPARKCQYSALKLLYERPFRAWLKGRDAKTLNGVIDRAVARDTKAARNLNDKGDPDRRELVVAKAKALGRLATDETIEKFFFRLSAATASEMRVQRGYESDAGAARKQAGYIEDLKCDVVALGFAAYLGEAGFGFVLELAPDASKPERPLWSLEEIPIAAPSAVAESWRRRLYFLLHLAPVEEAGRLLHQLRKWEILAKGAGERSEKIAHRVAKICGTLELYLDMHDAKFEGGEALIGAEPFRSLFEDAGDFGWRFFSAWKASGRARTRTGGFRDRGLREIMRFGDLRALGPIFSKHQIAAEDVREYQEAERVSSGGRSLIAELQTEAGKPAREMGAQEQAIHRRGSRRIQETLAEVTRHRHLAARVTLTDHVRLHQLLMAVLGRLVDFFGFWERDLYFVTLALLYEAGLRPQDVLRRRDSRPSAMGGSLKRSMV